MAKDVMILLVALLFSATLCDAYISAAAPLPLTEATLRSDSLHVLLLQATLSSEFLQTGVKPGVDYEFVKHCVHDLFLAVFVGMMHFKLETLLDALVTSASLAQRGATCTFQTLCYAALDTLALLARSGAAVNYSNLCSQEVVKAMRACFGNNQYIAALSSVIQAHFPFNELNINVFTVFVAATSSVTQLHFNRLNINIFTVLLATMRSVTQLQLLQLNINIFTVLPAALRSVINVIVANILEPKAGYYYFAKAITAAASNVMQVRIQFNEQNVNVFTVYLAALSSAIQVQFNVLNIGGYLDLDEEEMKLAGLIFCHMNECIPEGVKATRACIEVTCESKLFKPKPTSSAEKSLLAGAAA